MTGRSPINPNVNVPKLGDGDCLVPEIKMARSARSVTMQESLERNKRHLPLTPPSSGR